MPSSTRVERRGGQGRGAARRPSSPPPFAPARRAALLAGPEFARRTQPRPAATGGATISLVGRHDGRPTRGAAVVAARRGLGRGRGRAGAPAACNTAINTRRGRVGAVGCAAGLSLRRSHAAPLSPPPPSLAPDPQPYPCAPGARVVGRPNREKLQGRAATQKAAGPKTAADETRAAASLARSPLCLRRLSPRVRRGASRAGVRRAGEPRGRLPRLSLCASPSLRSIFPSALPHTPLPRSPTPDGPPAQQGRP
jgi:hypothetical protein